MACCLARLFPSGAVLAVSLKPFPFGVGPPVLQTSIHAWRHPRVLAVVLRPWVLPCYVPPSMLGGIHPRSAGKRGKYIAAPSSALRAKTAQTGTEATHPQYARPVNSIALPYYLSNGTYLLSVDLLLLLLLLLLLSFLIFRSFLLLVLCLFLFCFLFLFLFFAARGFRRCGRPQSQRGGVHEKEVLLPGGKPTPPTRAHTTHTEETYARTRGVGRQSFFAK